MIAFFSGIHLVKNISGASCKSITKNSIYSTKFPKGGQSGTGRVRQLFFQLRFPEIQRSLSGDLFELPAEIILVAEAGLPGNFRNGQIAETKKAHCFGNAEPYQVMDRGTAGRIHEIPHQGRLGHTGNTAEIRQRDIFLVMRVQISENFS